MASYIIEGNRSVSGSITPSGNKNEALPALVACLLTDKQITLKNMPRITDVMIMCSILEDIGVQVNWSDDSTLTLHASNVDPYKLTDSQTQKKCSEVRAAILFLGPMLSRCKEITLALPGGDVIGARKIDTHFDGIKALGGKINFGKQIIAKIESAKGCNIFLDEPSVTATENILLLSVLADGHTIIENAACEPHVTGLCHLLNAMGAKITGIESNRLAIQGVKTLGSATHTISSDFMEVASFVCLAAACKGTLTIQNVDYKTFQGITKSWQKLGINPEFKKDSIYIEASQDMIMQTNVSGSIAQIYSGPWPGFPTDLMSTAIVAATQASGAIIFFEKMFEGRMFFTDKLLTMGAKIVLCDPHRVVVNGPSQLYAAKLSSPDVRAGMSLIIAACAARGKSVISNIYQVQRGYHDVVGKLKSIGIAITESKD